MSAASGAPDRRAPLGRGPMLALRAMLLATFVAGVAISGPSVIGLAWFIPYAGVGSVLVLRRPGLPISWLVLATGWPFVFASLELPVPASAFSDGTLGPVTAVVAVVSSSAGLAGFYLIALLAMVFPSSRLPHGRWGTVTRVAATVGAAVLILGVVMPVISVSLSGSASGVAVPNPLAMLPDLPLWRVMTPDAVALVVIPVMVVGILSILARFRASRGVERQQLRWLASALVFVIAGVAGGFALGFLVPALADTGVIWLGAIVAYPCVPIAIGIAVLRYRLYEIDRIISRTLGWTVVTAILVMVFAGVVLALQSVLAGYTQGQTLAVATSTLVASALFQPVRRRVQAVVDRRFDRTHYDGQRAVDAFAEELRDTVEFADIDDDIRRLLQATVRPAHAGLWLRAAGERVPGQPAGQASGGTA